MPYIRSILVHLNPLLFVIFLAALCRSCLVDESFEVIHDYAHWPNGIVMEIPTNSRKPQEWSLEGHPPLMRGWCRGCQSGYGRFAFYFGASTCSYPTNHFDWAEVPQAHKPLSGPTFYSSNCTSL